MTRGISEELTKALSFGEVYGGYSESTDRWEAAIGQLSKRVQTCIKGKSSPLKVNVVFHVPGHILKPNFAGTRTATFSRSKTSLMIQVALAEEAPEDIDAYLLDALTQAIDKAEQWARRNKVAPDLGALRRVLIRLRNPPV